MNNKALKRRIIEISYKHKLSHIGSCLTAVDIIKEIYDTKKEDEKFVLSSGHAGLALYVVLEEYLGRQLIGDSCVSHSAEYFFKKHGVHPNRDRHIDCSSGSLGNGLPISLGMALADRSKNTYCLISDGELAEGSIHEALRIKKQQKVDNLKVYLNWNGWGAYDRTDWITWKMIEDWQEDGIIVCGTANPIPYIPLFDGQDAHYVVMDEKDYKEIMEIFK